MTTKYKFGMAKEPTINNFFKVIDNKELWIDRSRPQGTLGSAAHIQQVKVVRTKIQEYHTQLIYKSVNKFEMNLGTFWDIKHHH